MSDADDGETQSVQTRWPYTNDVIAGGYLFSYLVLTAADGAGVVDLTVVPTGWRMALVTIALVAAAWTFGSAAVKAAANLRN